MDAELDDLRRRSRFSSSTASKCTLSAVTFWGSARQAFRRLKAQSLGYREMNKDEDSSSRVVFLFDVDNTLLDNDRVAADLQRHLASEVGAEGAQEYWRIFEELRTELGYADYLGALQRYRAKHPHAQQLLRMSAFLINYPFAERLFPDSIKVIEHVKQWGPAVILSDGDVVFQPLKISR